MIGLRIQILMKPINKIRRHNGFSSNVQSINFVIICNVNWWWVTPCYPKYIELWKHRGMNTTLMCFLLLLLAKVTWFSSHEATKNTTKSHIQVKKCTLYAHTCWICIMETLFQAINQSFPYITSALVPMCKWLVTNN